MIQRCFTAALLALSLLSPSLLPASERGEWKQVTATGGFCTIQFPIVPEKVEQKMPLSDGGTLPYDVYLAPLGEHALCMLLIAEYPSALPQGSEMTGLEGLVRGILSQNGENQLVFAERMSNQNQPAIDFLIQNQHHYFRGHALLVGNRLYLIAIEGRKSEFKEATYQRFLGSFKLSKS